MSDAAKLRRSLSLGDLLVYGLVFIVPIALRFDLA
jgi:hypothetical protein